VSFGSFFFFFFFFFSLSLFCVFVNGCRGERDSEDLLKSKRLTPERN